MSVQPMRDELDEFLAERNKFSLKQRLESIVITAKNIPVMNEDGFRKITNLYAESKDWEKKIEFSRKQANAPDQDRINARNDKAKELLAPLKQIQMIAKDKTHHYQMMLEDIKKKEEERVKDIVDLLGLDDMPYIPPVDKTLRGDGAVVYTRTVMKFRIIDESKVPAKYLRVDEDAIERDIKLGVGSIEGVEIYEDKVTQLKSR